MINFMKTKVTKLQLNEEYFPKTTLTKNYIELNSNNKKADSY